MASNDYHYAKVIYEPRVFLALFDVEYATANLSGLFASIPAHRIYPALSITYPYFAGSTVYVKGESLSDTQVYE